MSDEQDKRAWADFYLYGVSGAEVEEILWIKLPPMNTVAMLTSGYRKSDMIPPGVQVGARDPCVLSAYSLSRFLTYTFDWRSSKEGYGYWSNHNHRAKMLDSVEVITKLREAKKLSKGVCI